MKQPAMQEKKSETEFLKIERYIKHELNEMAKNLMLMNQSNSANFNSFWFLVFDWIDWIQTEDIQFNSSMKSEIRNEWKRNGLRNKLNWENWNWNSN